MLDTNVCIRLLNRGQNSKITQRIANVNEITEAIISAAIEVRRALGPGLRPARTEL